VDICVIEDDAQQRRLLVERLRAAGYSVVHAECGAAGLRTIYQHRPRVLICDIMLPDLDGIQICRQVRADPTLDGLYILIVTAHDQDGRKKKALNAGADDYLRKPCDPEELRARIRNGLRLHRLQERLHQAALTDGLTGLWNHVYFRQTLEREFQRTRRYGGVVSLLMIDVDHFKAVNDTYGHEAGNVVLRMVARHIQSSVRDIDTVARYGGEEFAVICPGTHLAEARRLAERLRQGVPKVVRVPDHPDLAVHVSVGLACSDDATATSMVSLIDLADRALYHAKRLGRNRIVCARDLHEPCGGPASRSTTLDEIDRLRKENVALAMRSKELCLQSVWALIQALEARDGYCAWHSRNVTIYTKWLVEAAGWSKTLAQAAINAAMLHDLGKIGVPDRLLLEPRLISPDDAALLRQVPLITCRILEPLRVFETETLIVRHLRECYDGSGYPDGLAGEEIPVGSRLLAVAEAFDALTCDRADPPGLTVEQAVQRILEEAGTRFDPQFARLLADAVRRQPRRWHEQVEHAQARLTVTLAGKTAMP